MLCSRVIPIVLLDGFSVLKTINFKTRRNLGSPITVVRTYNTRNVDELIILDIDAAKQDRHIDLWTIKDITEDCFMPLTVGGGIKSLEDVNKTLLAGADKVSLNGEALSKPNLVKDSARDFGSQCIVVSIDYLQVDGIAWVYDHRLGQATDILLYEWLQEAENLGAGEILLNSVDLDGAMTEPDLHTIEEASQRVKIPVIYAGGIATAGHCSDVIKAGAHAVAASSIFHFTSITPNDCKMAMSQQGIATRV